MTQRRRSSKRNRNKSSPQIDSSPKKHRTNIEEKKTSVSIQESVVSVEDSLQSEQSEHFDTAGVGLNDSITSSVPSSPVTSVTSVTPTSELSHPMSNGKMNNGEMASVSQQDNSGMDTFDPVAVPQMGPPPPTPHSAVFSQMDPNMSTPPPHSAMFNQMDPNMYGGGVSPHMFQSSGPMPQFSLSETDVMRIAMKTKTLLAKDIELIVSTKVALAVQPFQSQLSSMQSELNSVKSELETLKGSIEKANIKHDDLEQYSRRSCLRISGIPEEDPSEDVFSLVLELSHTIGADIRPADIDRAHRVGKMHDIPINDKRQGFDANQETIPKSTYRGREIIVKFQSHQARMNMLKGRTNLQQSKLKMFINEDLTQSRKALAFQCRQLKREKKIKKAWIYGGNVYIKDLSDSELCIKTMSDLKSYLPNPQNQQPAQQPTQQPGSSHVS